MEQFIVSARKYRPQTFKDVVGQSAITNTLLNAIENNHLASALLFTGPRGVGKTTSTVNIGAALALKDFRVLLVDLDPQANLTQNFKIKNIEISIYDNL